jgi:hypothetical protein
LVIVREGEILFETKARGVSGFLQAINQLENRLYETSIADTVVGGAAAALCTYSKVASVFAETISEEGIRVLEENNIAYQFETKVSKILNNNKTDICPFEKLVMDTKNPREAYIRLKRFAESLKIR